MHRSSPTALARKFIMKSILIIDKFSSWISQEQFCQSFDKKLESHLHFPLENVILDSKLAHNYRIMELQGLEWNYIRKGNYDGWHDLPKYSLIFLHFSADYERNLRYHNGRLSPVQSSTHYSVAYTLNFHCYWSICAQIQIYVFCQFSQHHNPNSFVLPFFLSEQVFPKTLTLTF